MCFGKGTAVHLPGGSLFCLPGPNSQECPDITTLEQPCPWWESPGEKVHTGPQSPHGTSSQGHPSPCPTASLPSPPTLLALADLSQRLSESIQTETQPLSEHQGGAATQPGARQEQRWTSLEASGLSGYEEVTTGSAVSPDDLRDRAF